MKALSTNSKNKGISCLVCLFVFIMLLIIPCPNGLKQEGWLLLAIFVTTILAIILKIMPIGVTALLAIIVLAITKITGENPKSALANTLVSFSNPLIWLIVISIMISIGLKKTGLGTRIGFFFVSILGKSTLGIGYGLVICEMFLAPFTPSNTARGGGIMHPIMRSIADAFDSKVENKTENKIGKYLALVNYHANPITSAMFLTATAPNPLVVDYVAQVTHQNFQLTWGSWAFYLFLPCLVALLVMPYAIYLLCPPEIKNTPNASSFAKSKMKELGKISIKEYIMIGVFILLLLLWADAPMYVFGSAATLDPTLVAIIGLFILVVTGTINWDDVLLEKNAWDTLIWFGVLVMMADQLNKLGVMTWFSSELKNIIFNSGISWQLSAFILISVFMYSHYLFASAIAHVSAMMLAFLTVGYLVIPAEYTVPFTLMMLASTGIMMTLTHYATGTSPIIFGSGYATLGIWWKIGFIMSIVNMTIIGLVGSIWWKVLGLW